MRSDSSICLECAKIFQSNWKLRRKSKKDDEARQEDEVETLGATSEADSYEGPDWLQSTFDEDNEPTLKPFRHHNLKDLESCAETCKLCNVFWDYLSDLLPELEPETLSILDRAIGIVQVQPAFDALDDSDSENEVDYRASGFPMSLVLGISYFMDGNSDSEEALLPLTVEFDLLPADKWPEAIACVPETATLISKDTTDAIGSWVAECQNEHVSCWRSAEAALKSKLRQNMPTRLLHIITDDPENIRIRLVDTETLHPNDGHSDYITLSHCWGGALPMRLLQSNYASFRTDIKLQTLPKTFRDAIAFSQACGVRFVWIDALCIIQDSKTDWLHESLLMASVYSFAYLNIAATYSQDGHGGLFRPKDKQTLTTCIVSATWDTFPPGKYLCLDHTTWERRVELAPLNRRAWVFQERLLAPRTVHFAADQVWWECRGTRANETHPSGVPDYVLDTEGRFVEQLANLDHRDRVMSNGIWLSIVEGYTRARLTKDIDRLIALSGVALVIQETLHWKREDYYAGLWKPDLVVDLLWQVNESVPSRRQTTYVAPTWSWASVNGEVFFGRKDDRDIIRRSLVAKVENVSVKTEGDAFGLVKHGSLILRARLYEAIFYDPIYIPSPMMGKLKFGNDQVELENKVHFYEYLDDETIYKRDKRDEIVCVWCVISTFATPHLPDQSSTNGLILQRATEEMPGVYRRIGWSRLVHSDSNVNLARQFTKQSLSISNIDRLEDGFYRIEVI